MGKSFINERKFSVNKYCREFSKIGQKSQVLPPFRLSVWRQILWNVPKQRNNLIEQRKRRHFCGKSCPGHILRNVAGLSNFRWSQTHSYFIIIILHLSRTQVCKMVSYHILSFHNNPQCCILSVQYNLLCECVFMSITFVPMQNVQIVNLIFLISYSLYMYSLFFRPSHVIEL